MISYAQNFEDVILSRVFEEQTTGFYIDIGAWDPEVDSVTKHFYDKGWRGINVEPVEKYFHALSSQRTRDTNLNVAVGKTSGQQVFFNFEPVGNSTLDDSLADYLKDEGFDYEVTTVDVTTLTDICEQYAPAIIDFLKVDVEGWESDVLHGCDWSRFRPRVLIVEAVKPITHDFHWDEWEPYLLEQGYLFVYFDRINRFYIRNEEPELAKHFTFPPNILDNYQTNTTIALQNQNNGLVNQNNELQNQTNLLKRQYDELQKFHRALNEEVVALHEQVDAATARACHAEEELQAVHSSRSFRFGYSIRRLVLPFMPLLRPMVRLKRKFFGLFTMLHNFLHCIQRPVREKRLTHLYHQALASGQPFTFPLPWIETSPPLRNVDGPLAQIRTALQDDLTCKDIKPEALSEAIASLRHQEEFTLKNERFGNLTRAAIMQAEIIELLLSSPRVPEGTHRAQSFDRNKTGPLVIVDVRCLQKPAYLIRGIGRHAKNILVAVADTYRDEKDLVFLVDPALPDLDPDLDSLAKRSIAVVDKETLDSVDHFIELSPMTDSPGPALPLLLTPGVHCTAIIYDFIPGEFPTYYLKSDEEWIAYRAQLEVLACYDSFFTISNATTSSLPRFLGNKEISTKVTGVANPLQNNENIKDYTDSGEALPYSRFVLIIGSPDSRKNPLAAIAAIAKCSGVLRRRLGLVVVGQYSQELQEIALDFAIDCGMGKNRVMFYFEVTDKQLRSLYAHAETVVVPSFAEGFSIPVVEAISSGTPVIASDIDVHRELLDDGWWLATPDDPIALSQCLDKAFKNSDLLYDHQRETINTRFSKETVISHVKDGLSEIAKHKASVDKPVVKTNSSRCRPRIAVITPLPPQRTSVASYSAFTMRALADYADLVIYSDKNCTLPSDTDIEIKPYSISPYTDRSFDAVISVLGNSYFHIPILEYFLEFGGAAISHAQQMTDVYHFIRSPEELAALLSRHTEKTVHACDVSDGTYISQISQPDQIPSIVYDEIAPRAQPLFVHSSGLSKRILTETGVNPVVLPYVPYHLPVIETINSEVVTLARQSLGFHDEALHIATFGIPDQLTKAVEVILDAIALLHQWGVDCQIHIVGQATEQKRNELLQYAQKLEILQYVQINDCLPTESWEAYLLAADAAVQLRTLVKPPFSEALLDCMAFGVPCVATDALVDEMQAPAYVCGIPDRFSGLLLAEELSSVLQKRRIESCSKNEPLRSQWLEERKVDKYALRLLDTLGLGEFTS